MSMYVLAMKGNIRVFCRVRPVLELERKGGGAAGEVNVISYPFGSDEEMVVQRDPQTRSRFEFDRVIKPEESQVRLYQSIIVIFVIHCPLSFIMSTFVSDYM